MIFHAEGHRVLVASVASSSGDSSFTEYFCEGPTCSWHCTELLGECKDFVNLDSDLLTGEMLHAKIHKSPEHERSQEAHGQLLLLERDA